MHKGQVQSALIRVYKSVLPFRVKFNCQQNRDLLNAKRLLSVPLAASAF